MIPDHASLANQAPPGPTSKPCLVCGSPGTTHCWSLWVCNDCFSDWLVGCPPPSECPEGTLAEVNAGWERDAKAYFRRRYTSLWKGLPRASK